MNNKKSVVFFLFLLLALLLFSSCQKAENADGRLKIVCSLFPQYDFARQVAGDAAEVILLRQTGDAHSGEITSADVRTLASCDLFICVGGTEDYAFDRILKANAPDLPVLRMLEEVEPLTDEDGDEIDEHVWTSPKNAIRITQAICEKLASLDGGNASVYRENADVFLARLTELDAAYEDYFSEPRTLIFGDRFPFLYLAHDYGITCFAAFPGCSEETEPSANTVAMLIEKIRSEKIDRVYYLENSSHAVADSLAEATGVGTSLFHSCHTLSEEEIESGIGYVEIMTQNLETLKNR